MMISLPDINIPEDGDRYYERVILPSYAPRGDIFKLKDDSCNFDIDLFGKEVVNGYHSVYNLGPEIAKHVEATGTIRNYCGRISADYLHWDMDDDSDLQNAYDDTATILDRLDSMGANLGAVTVCISGGKGFHVLYKTDDISSLGAQKNLHHIVKHVCANVAEGVESWDDSVYDKTRVIRALNSKHKKTGKYKVPFSVREFRATSWQELMRIASKQKEGWETEVDSGVEYITQLIAEKQEEPEAKQELTRKYTSGSMLEYLREGAPAGDTNNFLASYAGILRRRNFDNEFMYSCLALANNNCERPIDDNELRVIVNSISKYDVDEKYIDPEDSEITTMRQNLERYKEIASKTVDINTPFTHFNAILSGLFVGQVLLVIARPGVGKGASNDTLLPQPSGEYIRVGDIKIGDDVIGSNGKPTEVTGVFPLGVKQMYAVTFDSGIVEEVTDEHLWEIKRRSTYSEEVMETKDIMEYINHQRTLKCPKLPSIKFTKPVEYTCCRELEVDPWLLGVIIGDGYLPKAGSPVISNTEIDIQDRIYGIVSARRTDTTVYCSGMAETMRNLGLSGKVANAKHIPSDYLTANVDDRISLLQGLCDTDGYVTKNGNSIEFCTVSEQLGKDVVRIVRSLGGKVSLLTKESPTYTYKGEKLIGQRAYRLYISFYNGIVPVSSKKHLKRYRGMSQKSSLHIKSIEPIDKFVEATCIRVDADDHLYLTDNFIVTHNTLSTIKIGLEFARELKEYVLFISLEMDKSSVGFRAAQCQFSRTLESDNLENSQVRHQVLNNEDFVEETATYWEHMLTVDKTLRSIEAIKKYYLKAQELAPVKIGVVIIDYMQLMSGSGDRSELDLIARGLKSLGKDLQCRVIACAQVNRSAGDDCTKPNLQNIKEMGSLEDSCDICVSMWNDRIDDTRVHNEVVKGREGGRGTKWDYIQRGMAYKSVDFFEAQPTSDKPTQWGR